MCLGIWRASFQCWEGQNIGLDRRLPGITQRDVLSNGRARDHFIHALCLRSFHAPGPFPGAARCDGLWPQMRLDKYRGVSWVRAKAAPRYGDCQATGKCCS